MKPFYLIVCLAALLQPPVLADNVVAADMEARLRAGEILLQDTRTDEAGGAGKAQVFAYTEARAFWDVIVSCDLAFVFVDGMRVCETLEASDGRAVVRQVIKKHWLLPKIEYSFESQRRPYKKMTFALIEGDLDIMEGSWRFTPAPAGVLVEYEARIKPSFPVPRWLVRRTIRKDTPDLIACIRGLANGSGSEQMLKSDLARCPGER
ncbi:MAG: SRPBCC family protein [Xanthomonadales bacterium]|jgi:hypothetical protein|nr:SRPBCC family protein [Xanthomonadales bacterium]